MSTQQVVSSKQEPVVNKFYYTSALNIILFILSLIIAIAVLGLEGTTNTLGVWGFFDRYNKDNAGVHPDWYIKFFVTLSIVIGVGLIITLFISIFRDNSGHYERHHAVRNKAPQKDHDRTFLPMGKMAHIWHNMDNKVGWFAVGFGVLTDVSGFLFMERVMIALTWDSLFTNAGNLAVAIFLQWLGPTMFIRSFHFLRAAREEKHQDNYDQENWTPTTPRPSRKLAPIGSGKQLPPPSKNGTGHP